MKPLTRCPQCRYSLKGLPADHKCPECGFEYDANSSMWEHRAGKGEIASYIVGGVIWILIVFTQCLSNPFGNSTFRSASTLLIVPLASIVVYRGLRIRRSGYVVCTTHQGVWIKKGHQFELFPWAEIDGVFWNVANKRAGLNIKSRARAVYIPKVFRRQSDFEEMRMAVRRRKQMETEESCSGS